MSHIIPEDRPLLTLRFNELPPERMVRIFGVQYASLRLDEGGEFFITRFGWGHLANILPEEWYADRKYCTAGTRLPGSTGMVYRVPTTGRGFAMDLVVKFSRFAQDVPFGVEGTFPDDIPREVLDEMYWNDPFEEFGILYDLRRGRFGPENLVVRTKRPLCIYCPREDIPDWKLGRSRALLTRHARMLERDQSNAQGGVRLHGRRIYILVYEWVKGYDAEQCFQQGLLTEKEMVDVTRRAARELSAKGFVSLDHKPRHVILRPRPGGQLLRGHNDNLIYTLIDFELLQRTGAYVEWLKEQYA